MYYLSLDGSVGIITRQKNLDHILRDCPVELSKEAFIKVAKDEFENGNLDLKYEQERWHQKERNHPGPIKDSRTAALNMSLKP